MDSVNPKQEENTISRNFSEELVKGELAARVEPFDSFWHDVGTSPKASGSFYKYYKHNYLRYLPKNPQARILVISCGPGFFLAFLRKHGYENAFGIDSDPQKIAQARAQNLDCRAAHAFSFLRGAAEEFDLIVAEQELNHLTTQESIEFLKLCWKSLRGNGSLLVYGLNGANPIVGTENLAHNIDHFNTFTEYSLKQLLTIAGFKDVHVFPLKLYVFWTHPLNYVGLAATAVLSLFFRLCFALYGKSVKIFTKKIAAVCYKRP